MRIWRHRRHANSRELGLPRDSQAHIMPIDIKADLQCHTTRPVRVQPQGKGIKPVLRRQYCSEIRNAPADGRQRLNPVFKLIRPDKVYVAHNAGFRAITLMPIDQRQHPLSFLIAQAGKNQMAEHLGRPLQIIRFRRLFGDLHRRVRATHGFHKPAPFLGRRHRVKVHRIAVKESVIKLIHCAGIEFQRPVIPACVELLGQPIRLFHLRRDFIWRMAQIGQPQSLVMGVFVDVALLFQIGAQVFAPPDRPVVAVDQHVGPIRKKRDRLVNGARPQKRIAHLRTTWGQHIVHRLSAHLRHAQHAMIRQAKGKLRRSFGAGRHLKHETHAINDKFITGCHNELCRWHKGALAFAYSLANSPINRAFRPWLQGQAKLVNGPARCVVPAQHALRGGKLHEFVRRPDRRRVLRIHDAP